MINFLSNYIFSSFNGLIRTVMKSVAWALFKEDITSNSLWFSNIF